MIREFALEPRLVGTWNEDQARYYRSQFSMDSGRVVSRWPAQWRNDVLNAFSESEYSGSTRRRKQLSLFLRKLKGRTIGRPGGEPNPDKTAGWLAGALREHERCPFDAILAGSNPGRHSDVLLHGDIDEHPLWQVPRGLLVDRRAEAMGDAIASTLRLSRRVILVDPYFRPRRRENQEVLGSFCERMFRNRPGPPPERLTILTEFSCKRGRDSYFDDACRSELPGRAPEGLRVVVKRLQRREGRDQMHNRYVLTDLCGIQFGTGLDTGSAGATDDVTLLSEQQYRYRWRQYAQEPPADFKVVGRPVELVGRRRLGGGGRV